MDEPLIRYKNVNINQQELGVLEDVNLELNKGEFVYLIGKVGSGKSPNYAADWESFSRISNC